MRIGLDFDNTIVSYDKLFHKVALEKQYIPESVDVNKNAVRDHLRAEGKEDLWTEMQGYVYGARMQEASIFSGAIDTMLQLLFDGHELYIISHKTQYPYLGKKYDLHDAARQFISTQLLDSEKNPIFSDEHVFFNETKDAKVKKIETLECDVFLDDLPEILSHADFPKDVTKYLFSPKKQGSPEAHYTTVCSWEEFMNSI